MNEFRLNDTLTLLNLKQSLPGFNRDPFIGSWVLQDDPCLIFDVGPSASVHQLLDYLEHKRIHTVDYVLISHIHIDHAGGLAKFIEAFPQTRVIVHDRGVQHLADPTRLWEGSLKTLGHVAEAYGKIDPVPEDNLIPHTKCTIRGLTVLETPGHAPHHLSFVYKDKLFAGEAAGIYLPHWDEDYTRPPTPPRFILEHAVNSVDRMLELDDMPILYSHFGFHRSSRIMLARYREQLFLWRDIIAKKFKTSRNSDVKKQCVDALLEQDPALTGYKKMNKTVREREVIFIENGVSGYLGYLREETNA